MRFEQLDQMGRTDQVREQLLAAMTRGDLRPGDKLPSEAALVAEFGVSRVSVREALRGLQTMGLIEVQQGRGSFVARGPGERYFLPFAGWLKIHRDEILDLMKVRGALDELAAAEAADNVTAAGLKQLRAAETAFAEAARDPEASIERMVQTDIAFHNEIARASGSSLLPDLLAELNQIFTESRRAAFALGERAEQSADEHAVIVAAIRKHDPKAAREAACRHLDSVRASLNAPDFLEKLAGIQSGAGADVSEQEPER